jgi:membrane protein DedA with SNARE-associated domain
MHLFTDFIQPLTQWIHVHPEWALFITFLVSFGESLAIIGGIVPGSVTMTAIGILAGSGIMPIGLTCLAAIFGAIAGDSLSYTIGYFFSDRLVDVWPFKRYPSWIDYGKTYFEKHGGKSVLIGRFVGPLRCIIPLIAGMLRMNRWHFLIANVVSAIGWALLFVMPGVLIGAAGSELSSEAATRLFIAVLAGLVLLWLLSKGMRWLFVRTSHVVRARLRTLWLWSKHHPHLARLLKALTPNDEKNHYYTAILILLLLVSSFIAVIIMTFVMQKTLLVPINHPVHLFLQSLRTPLLDLFFILISLSISPISLLTFGLAIIGVTIYYRQWRLLRYWLSLSITCLVLTFIFAVNIELPTPEKSTQDFLAIQIMTATSFFGFLVCYINAYYKSTIMLVLRLILITLLLITGLSSIYLGDHWMATVIAAYFIGLTISLLHWLLYRRGQTNRLYHRLPQLPITLACSLFILSTGVAYLVDFKKLARDHYPHLDQYVLTPSNWWNQSKPILPVYTRNRIGHRVGFFNLQYVGTLESFESALIHHGWKKQVDLLFYSFVRRAGGHNSGKELPLLAQLYLNQKPSLIMTYQSKKDNSIYIVRLWRSNYQLSTYLQPIWIGSIIYLPAHKHEAHTTSDVFAPLSASLDNFKLNWLDLPKDKLETLSQIAPPKLLIIKESF